MVFHDSLSIDAGAIIEGNLKQRTEKETVELTAEPTEKEVKTLIEEDDSGLSFVNKQATDKSER